MAAETSSNTRLGGNVKIPCCSACACSAAVCDAIVSSFFCKAEETRAYIAAGLVVLQSSFLTRPAPSAGPSWCGTGTAVRPPTIPWPRCGRTHGLRLDQHALHRVQTLPLPAAKTPVDACVTTAEIVLPDSRALSRTRATNPTGSRPVKHVLRRSEAQPSARPDTGGLLDQRRPTAQRAPDPPAELAPRAASAIETLPRTQRLPRPR